MRAVQVLVHVQLHIGRKEPVSKNELTDAFVFQMLPMLKVVLKKKLNAWRTEVIARMPIPNPSFDPDRANEWWSMRTGRPVASDKRKRFPQTEKEL